MVKRLDICAEFRLLTFEHLSENFPDAVTLDLSESEIHGDNHGLLLILQPCTENYGLSAALLGINLCMNESVEIHAIPASSEQCNRNSGKPDSSPYGGMKRFNQRFEICPLVHLQQAIRSD